MFKMSFDSKQHTGIDSDDFVHAWMGSASESILVDSSYLHTSGDSMPSGTSSFQSEYWTNEYVMPIFQPRRLSLVSPTASSLSDEYTTSPMTPQNAGTWVGSAPPVIADSEYLTTVHPHCDISLYGQQLDRGNSGMSPVWDLPLLLPAEPQTPIRCFNGGETNFDHTGPSFNSHRNDPTISRQIFADPVNTPAHAVSDRTALGHPSTTGWPKMQTIAPKETFQYLMASSPPVKIEMSSPVESAVIKRTDYSPDSSPFPMPRAHIIPSQSLGHDLNASGGISTLMPEPMSIKRSASRLLRRPCNRETTAPLTCTPHKRSSGCVYYGTVIPQNSFACTFPDCRDKATGEPKRFKRQEHRKRHEVTVHKRKKKFFCWVPGCSTGFTRTDNLKMHIKNTHGKDSPAQRNRYVATLDAKNRYFDPHWQGELTDDGYPLIKGVAVHRCSASDCEKTFHLVEKFKLHLEQHHGKRATKPKSGRDDELGESSSTFVRERGRKVKPKGT